LSPNENNNKTFVFQSTLSALKEGFPNLSEADQIANLEKLFTTYNNEAEFKVSPPLLQSNLQDYMIQLDKYTAQF
jgi:hypothetical protein